MPEQPPEASPSPYDIRLEDLTQPPEALANKWRLFDKRLDYALEHFTLHARQRTTVFNFFIVFAGLLGNAYGALVREHHFGLGAVFGYIAATLTLFFIFLDHRNEELVHIAEDNLCALEEDLLYRNYVRSVEWPRRRRWIFRWKQVPTSDGVVPYRHDRQLGLHLRERADKATIIRESPYRHGMWFPCIQSLIMVIFFAGGCYSLFKYATDHRAPAPTTASLQPASGSTADRPTFEVNIRSDQSQYKFGAQERHSRITHQPVGRQKPPCQHPVADCEKK